GYLLHLLFVTFFGHVSYCHNFFEFFRGLFIRKCSDDRKIKESRPACHAGETHTRCPEFQSSAKLRIIFPTSKSTLQAASATAAILQEKRCADASDV
ncbi:MAG: hypothetical protein K2I34_09275, partial [Paramuribaculum sp.]|nr:hypothetical protein [Paramuribaculum sp.]